MGKGKKNKAKHVARKAVDKKKYITVEDVYEPRHNAKAADGSLGKTEKLVEPADEASVNKELADEVKASCEPAGGEGESAALVDSFEVSSEPVGAVEDVAKPVEAVDEAVESVGTVEEAAEPERLVELNELAGEPESIVELVEPAGEPEHPVQIEDAFYGPSKLVGDAKETNEPAGEADGIAEPEGAVEEPAGAIEEVADAIEEPTELESAAEELVASAEGPEEPVALADAGKQADDRAEVRHGAHAALKKEEDVVDEANRESVETAPETAPENELAKKLSLPIVIGVAIAALVVGLLVGAFLLGGSGGSAITGKGVVSENELDSPIASYSYQGKNDSITVREVIEQSTSLEAAKDADGNYQMPTADTALGVVRNKLLVAEAERQGITVTDEDIAEYAATNLGTDDYEIIAANYQMDVDAVKALLRETCLMGKLRETVAPAQDVAMPDPPAQPKSDDEDALTASTKEYADYIIALAGDEWDAKKGAWASEEGPYASGLAGAYEITAKGATYEAAMAAYYIAYQLYAQESAEAGTQWADYVNGILSNATIEIYTLLA